MAARPAPLVLPAPMQGGALRGQSALRAGSARRARRRASPASQARMGSKPARGRAQPRRATHRERNEADGRGHGQRHAHRRLACLRLFDGSDSGVHHRADIEQSSWGGSWVPSGGLREAAGTLFCHAERDSRLRRGGAGGVRQRWCGSRRRGRGGARGGVAYRWWTCWRPAPAPGARAATLKRNYFGAGLVTRRGGAVGSRAGAGISAASAEPCRRRPSDEKWTS
jgi:hypothetical protein